MRIAARLLPAFWRRRASPNTLIARVAHLLAALCFEYRRALAAERRYHELRRTNRATGADIPRRLFAEMYSRPSHES